MPKRKENKEIRVYKLIDPISKRIKYIGVTSSELEIRRKGHINETIKGKHKSYKCSWIKSLLRKNLIPEIELVEIVPKESTWQEREKYWIKTFKELGEPLTNSTIGGDGALGVKLTAENRKNIGLAAKKLWQDPEYRKKMLIRDAKMKENPHGFKKGHIPPFKISPPSKETLKKMSLATKLRYKNGEVFGFKKGNQLTKGKLVTLETRKKLSEKAKKQWELYREKKKDSEAMKYASNKTG